MNNKGFAITTILYGTMILFLMLILAMLGILSSYKDKMDLLIESENGARNIINGFSGAMYGDIDLDGDVDMTDLTLHGRYVSGIITYSSRQSWVNMDIDADGDVDAKDLTLLARYVAGIDDCGGLPYSPCTE